MYIYVITHPKFKGWIKLGRTTDVEKRLNEYQTNCPDRAFKIEFKLKTEYVYNIENYFDNYILNNGYEWYNCDAIEAINIINKILDRIKVNPNYLKKVEKKTEIPLMMKKYHKDILYDYIIDDIIFHNLRELSIYVGVGYTKLTRIITKLNIPFEINGFKVIKQKHY